MENVTSHPHDSGLEALGSARSADPAEREVQSPKHGIGHPRTAEARLLRGWASGGAASELGAEASTQSAAPRHLRDRRDHSLRTRERPQKPQWHDRHQVASSRDNAHLPRVRRDYFDTLPNVRVSRGQYRDVPKHFAFNFDQFAGTSTEDQLAHLDRKFMDYPLRDHWPTTSKTFADESTLPSEHRVPVDILMVALPALKEEPAGSHKRKSWKVRVRASLIRSQAQSTSAHESLAAGLPKPVQDFFAWCVKTLGSVVHCWRLMDADGSMSICKPEFFKFLGERKYHASTQELWRCLDRDHSDMIDFMDFDPISAINISGFKRWAVEQVGSVEKLCKSLDANRNGKVTLEEFAEGCGRRGLKNWQSVYCIFRMCGFHGQKALSKGELVLSTLNFLDRWQCPEYLLTNADPVALAEWRTALLNCHKGSAITAWRKDLDRDGSMRVNWQEFTKVCKRMMQMKPERKLNVGGIWRALDRNMSGWISLLEFDKEAYTALSEFKTHAVETSGGCQRLLVQISPKGAHEVTLKDFRKALRDSSLGVPSEMDSESSDEEVAVRMGARRSLVEKARKDAKKEAAVNAWAVQTDAFFQALDYNRSGVITPDEVLFLDRWNPAQDRKEEETWFSLVDGLDALGDAHRAIDTDHVIYSSSAPRASGFIFPSVSPDNKSMSASPRVPS